MTIKQTLKVRNIENLYNSVKISDKKLVIIKSITLFIRLMAIAQRENNTKRLFSCELTMFLCPMCLFKDGLMWKLKKATLPNTLLTKKEEEHFCTKYDGLRDCADVQCDVSTKVNIKQFSIKQH